MNTVASQLEGIRVGIICLTAKNQSSPWLNFEAGAMSKLVDDSHVIPLAFDIEKGQIKNPLGQFQAVHFTREDMFDVASTINDAIAAPVPLTQAKLERAFDLAWPLFNTQIEKLRSEDLQDPLFEEPKRTPDDMLEEIVVAVRDQAASIEKILAGQTRSVTSVTQLELADRALDRIAAAWDIKSKLSVKRLSEMAEQLDEEDWRAIETAPFLLWYLHAYHGVSRPKTAKRNAQPTSSMDDVPF